MIGPDPILSVIVVSYNQPQLVKRCVRSLDERLRSIGTEVILVDNASTESVVECVRSAVPRVRILAQTENHGFAKGCNIGAAAARGNYLLFVNSDVEVVDDPTAEMLSRLSKEPGVGLVGCELYNEDGSSQPTAFRFPSLSLRVIQLLGIKALLLSVWPELRRGHGQKRSPDFLSGAFLMVRREVFSRFGGFDEGFFMYLEDADLAWRLRQAGLVCRLVKGYRVIHLGQHYEFSTLGPVTLRMNRGLLRFESKHRGSGAVRLLAVVTLPFLVLMWTWASVTRATARSRRVIGELVALYWRAMLRPQDVEDARAMELTRTSGSDM